MKFSFVKVNDPFIRYVQYRGNQYPGDEYLRYGSDEYMSPILIIKHAYFKEKPDRIQLHK